MTDKDSDRFCAGVWNMHYTLLFTDLYSVQVDAYSVLVHTWSHRDSRENARASVDSVEAEALNSCHGSK